MRMGKKGVRVVVYGRVQGVFFRDFTCREAKKLALCGWVRNCSDGTVECFLEGEKKDIERMLDWLGRGSPLAKVSRVDIREEMAEQGFADFEVKYG